MKKRAFSVLAATSLALGLMAAPAVAKPADLHCSDHQTETKIEIDDGWTGSQTVTVTDVGTGEDVDVVVTVEGGQVSFEAADPDVTLGSAAFCLKGGPANTGLLSGTTGDTSSIPNRGGQEPDISYVVLYFVTSVVSS